MPFDLDPDLAIGAVTRSVDSGEREGRPSRVVRITTGFDAPVREAWDAITRGERIQSWFLPVSGDLQPGGRYQLTGNAGGTILACEALRHLALTWEFGGEVSWVDAHLEADGVGRSRLTLEHASLEAPEHWARYGPGAAGVGWDFALAALARHLATNQRVDPAEFQAWTVSENGRAFVRASSEAWCRAAADAGEDEGAARAAAERTARFYLGEPEGPAA